MKILHVVPTYFPAVRYGGPIVAVHGLCKALVARGHEVDVLTTNVDGPGTLDVPVGRVVDVDGVQVRYFASSFSRLYWSAGLRAALREVSAYDVVHSHAVYLWPGIAAARAARRAGVPFVISPRGMLVPELISRKSALVKKAWLRLFERRSFAGASGIHFTSTLELEDAERLGILSLPQPFVVPNGIELEPRPSVPRDDRTLLFLGRINWKKRLDLVIAALPALPNVQLIVAGNDEERLTATLRAQADVLGVADRVQFPGPVYGSAKQELLARATLFVLLSTSENFGNAVLEALAMETPVILSRGVGLADDVLASDAGAIGVESIAHLLDDAPRREQMGRNGRRMVESRFTWPRVAEEMERAYLARLR